MNLQEARSRIREMIVQLPPGALGEVVEELAMFNSTALASLSTSEAARLINASHHYMGPTARLFLAIFVARADQILQELCGETDPNRPGSDSHEQI